MADDLYLNRLTPPGDQFTLITLRVLDEAPDGSALVEWYRSHLAQLVIVNRLEGVPDFAFSTGPLSPQETARTVARLASSEHDLDLSGREPDLTHGLTEPFGADSAITNTGYNLGAGRWLSVLVGTLNWRAVLADV